MKSEDVSTEDAVVDEEGTIWIHTSGRWRYFTWWTPPRPTSPPQPTEQPVLSWDVFDRLPDNYEPYTRLDPAAVHTLRWVLQQVSPK
jgi:hypothetical protein